MKNTSLFRRVLSVVLAVAMICSLLVPSISAEEKEIKTTATTQELELTPIDPGTLESQKQADPAADSSTKNVVDHKPTDVVRVAIVLDKASTLDAGFDMRGIAKNAAAKAYRNGLRADQVAMTAKIEKAIGGTLNVKMNLTLVANIISADVQYGQIEAIKALDGVQDVFLERMYEAQRDELGDEPNNGTAANMIGSNLVWANGLTGAGSRIAVIDTGADDLHQSFSGEGLEYAFAQTAAEKGMSYDEYVDSLNLLTVEEIESVKDQLTVSVNSAQAYLSTKIPFAYNYNEHSYNTDHQDTAGEHGSHVAGIATANRFVKIDGEFKPALDTVLTQGVAPDAQLIVMDVFQPNGKTGESIYMGAIEDAIILGCDACNLSLGSGSPGFGFSGQYEAILNKLVQNGMVVAFSAGNSGMWYDSPANAAMQYPYLYVDDINYATDGSPGSFTNTLATASVNNIGQTGLPLIFGDIHPFYTETSSSDYNNQPIMTLAGEEHEFVLVDGPGVDDNDHVGGEGDQFAALGSEVLTGKIAMCYRGSSSFFAKANAAVAQGAIGVVIINNTAGMINMNLTGYTGPAPCVSISKADGDAIKAAAEAVKDDDGNVLYYKGTMSVAETPEAQFLSEPSDTVEVSSFSSYGTPGTMVLKPEIMAPGGNIYSVWGANTGSESPTDRHDQYETMSGTSMASPQIAGMAGLMAQYIRENDLEAKTGLTARQLTNSLLMSTAHPVFDSYGDYWAVFRVGAGLANVADAVSAKSYILMNENATMFPDSAKDGKVKAELGDDANYTGNYQYSFTLYPMEESKTFSLRTDIFTQGVAGNGGYGILADTGTMLIPATTTYEINGETYGDSFHADADVNKDGKTDAADAQAILDYLTGELAEDAQFDETVADVDGDEAITSYDAKLILDSAASPVITITEPTEIKVNIQLDLSYAYALVAYYMAHGFYVEGYTYVLPESDEEGVIEDVTHSIPIFGFFGSYTDPAMLDRTSVIDEAYGTGKLPYTGNKNINYMTLKDANGATSVYMGNPYMIEEKFPVERLAMSSNTTVQSFTYLPIRNIANLGFAVTGEDGTVLYAQAMGKEVSSAFYYANEGKWYYTSPNTFNVGKALSAANVKEGDKVAVGFYALPEYYGILSAKLNGEVATDAFIDNVALKQLLEGGYIGDGAAIKYNVTIDDTAPVVSGAMQDLITGNIVVKCSDNNYVAYVAVMDKNGNNVYYETLPEQTEPGQELEVALDLAGKDIPANVVLLVADYAGNESAFKVNLGGNGSGDEDQPGMMLGFVTEKTTAAPGSGNRVWEINPDTLWYNHSTGAYEGLSNYANVDFAVTAAEYVEGYVFMAADDGFMYVAKLNAMDETSRVGNVSEAGYIYDMAYNTRNKKLYALGENNTIYTVDLITGELTKVAVVTLSGSTYAMNRLAIDDNGVFYTADSASPSSAHLYKFTLAGGGVVDPDPTDPDPTDPDPTEPSGEAAYAWDFETYPTDWTFVDSDGDGYNWFYHYNTGTNNHTAHSGSGVISSESYSNDAESALTPDNWAISPAVDLSEAETATLSVWACAQDGSWAAEKFALYAGTSTNISDMTMVAGPFTMTASTKDSGNYYNYTADLSDFLGEEEVYVAIRHYDCTDMFILNIDDVEILVGSEEPTSMNTRSGNVVATRVYDYKGSDNALAGWDFETDPTDWTFVDSDGDGYNWYYHYNTGTDNHAAHSGSGVISSESYHNNETGNGGTALTPDNWAISPAVNLSEAEAASLSVWACAQDGSYAAEKFALYAGTSTNISDMTMVAGPFTMTASTKDSGSYYNYTADLSGFLGEEEVYVAIRHYDCTDMFVLNIDDVEILGEGTTPVDPEPIDPEPIDPPAVLEITVDPVGTTTLGVWNYSNGGSMAWDHENNKLYLASNYNATQDYDHYLWVIDTTTGVAARANETQGTELSSSNPSARLYGSVRGLVIVPSKTSTIKPTDVATAIEVEPSEINIFVGQKTQVKAAVYPWTLTDKDVTFESADSSVASVNANGMVTGVKTGETTITVTTVAEPHLTAEVSVTVSVPPETELRAVIWDENGKGQASVFNSNATADWEALAEVGAFRWGALVGDMVYGSTADTLYAFDADTYELESFGNIDSSWIYSDATPLPQDFRDAFAAMGYTVGPIIGPCNGGTLLNMLDPEAGKVLYFNLSDTVFGEDPMATFAYAGRTTYNYDGDVDENGALFYLVTESGALYSVVMNHSGSINWSLIGNTGLDLTGVADPSNYTCASMIYDEENDFLYLAHHADGDDYAYLYAIDPADPFRCGRTGDFKETVWPVVGLYQYEPATDLAMTVTPTDVKIYEGDTAEIKIKVKLGETNEYTAEIADPTVCSFENGVITGLKEGQTTITITTVDTNAAGEHLTATINVKVKGIVAIDGVITGQVTDTNGARFTEISLTGATVSETGVAAPGSAKHGGRGGDIYVADINGMPTILDAMTYDPYLEWNGFDTDTYAQYPAMDFANFPTYLESSGSTVSDKVLMTTSIGWLVRPSYYGWNMSSYISDMAAVAYAGVSEQTDGTLLFQYYILGADGTLYVVGIDFENGARTNPEAILDTGIVLANQSDASMAVYAKRNADDTDFEQIGLVVADNATKMLWYIDFMAESADDAVGMIGVMDVENVTGLVGYFDETADVTELQGIEPFDPGQEPTDPGTYPTPAEGFNNPITVWDFETDPETAGWTFFNRDGDAYNWFWTPGSDYASLTAYEGNGMIVSHSYVNNVGAVNPDNFAITPAIDLSEYDDANFAFMAKGQDPSYAGEVFAVYAGTSANVGDMIKISPNYTATGDWTKYTASLSAFAGEEEVYVAIRHYNVTDMYMLDVDYAEVLTEGGEPVDPTEPEPTEPEPTDPEPTDPEPTDPEPTEPEPTEPGEPTTSYYWSFESADEIADWTMLDNDGDNKTFTVDLTSGQAHEGNGVLKSVYNMSTNVDDVAITPALDFSEFTSATLSFYAKRNSSSFQEHYAVYVGTTNVLEEMQEILPETVAEYNWVHHELDLAEYCGEDEVYIAFRHFNTKDQYYFFLDEVEIVTEGEVVEPTEPEPTEPDPTEPDPTEPAGEFETVLWDFEDAEDDADWTFVDANNDGNTFYVLTSNNALSGTRSLYCSYADTVNEWAISPAIDLSNAVAPELSVNGRRKGSGWAEKFALYAGTTPDIESMTQVLECTTLSGTTYAEYVADLSDFAGASNVYVAIRYYESPDMFGVYFDDVSVREHVETNVVDRKVANDGTKSAPMAFRTESLNLGFGRMDVPMVETSNEMMKLGEATNETTGSTNAVKAGLTMVPIRMPVDETTVGAGKVHIVLTEDEDVTNGLFTVTYDADKLTYSAAASTLPYVSLHHEIVEPAPGEEPALRTGVITVAYASAEVIPAETVLGTLDFTYTDVNIDTTVVVAVKERNEDVAVEEDALVIEIKDNEPKTFYLTEYLNDGDVVVLYNPLSGKAVSNMDLSEEHPEYRLGIDVTAANGIIETNETAVMWTVKVLETGVEFTDAEGHKLSMETKGLELDKTNSIWEIRNRNDEDKTVNIVNTTAAPGSSGDPKAMEWYTNFSEFSTHYLNADDPQFIFEIYNICAIGQFVDMAEYPHGTDEHAAVEWAFTHDPKITAGVDETHFGPDQTVTRGQAAFFLWTAEGRPTDFEMPEEGFTDVPEGFWCYTPVMWAKSKGITAGIGDGLFGVDLPLTRGQLLTMFWSAEGKQVSALENPYADITDPTIWYHDAAIWAYEHRLERGENGNFNADTACTRLSTVMYLYRYFTGKALVD